MSKQNKFNLVKDWLLIILGAGLGLSVNLIASSFYDLLVSGFNSKKAAVLVWSTVGTYLFADFFIFVFENRRKTLNKRVWFYEVCWMYVKNKIRSK